MGLGRGGCRGAVGLRIRLGRGGLRRLGGWLRRGGGGLVVLVVVVVVVVVVAAAAVAVVLAVVVAVAGGKVCGVAMSVLWSVSGRAWVVVGPGRSSAGSEALPRRRRCCRSARGRESPWEGRWGGRGCRASC